VAMGPARRKGEHALRNRKGGRGGQNARAVAAATAACVWALARLRERAWRTSCVLRSTAVYTSSAPIVLCCTGHLGPFSQTQRVYNQIMCKFSTIRMYVFTGHSLIS
jgi:hypothetical protein